MTLPLLMASVVMWVIVKSIRVLSGGGSMARTCADMTDGELGRAFSLWSARMAESTGWAALQFAAEQVERIEQEAARRSLRSASNCREPRIVELEADPSKPS